MKRFHGGAALRAHPCSCWHLQLLQDDVHGLSQVVHVGIRLHFRVIFIRRPGRRQRNTGEQGQDPKQAPHPWSSCCPQSPGSTSGELLRFTFLPLLFIFPFLSPTSRSLPHAQVDPMSSVQMSWAKLCKASTGRESPIS